MMIPSDSILALLAEKARTQARDSSRHFLCPSCDKRTPLYALSDGRRKCSVCGAKFTPEKKTDDVRLKQCADLFLCFCLNLTGRQASEMTGYHYRLVSDVYDHVRMLLAAQNLTPGKMQLLRTVEPCDHTVHDSAFCAQCRNRFDCKGRKAGDAPIFGVKIFSNGTVFIDPLSDDEASLRFDPSVTQENGKFSAYAGFICRGTFHRFTENERQKDGAEHLWAWMSERLKQHHGIWKTNVGLYLKELEWKYNNRLLAPEAQARTIAELTPANFLTSWGETERIALDLVQNRA